MSILADGRASLAALGIDQWQGGYPHRAVIEDDTARGDSYVVEADDRIVATAMIGFSGERDYDRIEEGSWLTSCTSVLRRGAPSGRGFRREESRRRDVSAGSRRRAGARERKRQRPHRHAPRQRAYEKAAGESRL